MVYDTKAISWNESLKQLQRRYTNKQVDRKEFEDIELMEFFAITTTFLYLHT